MRHYVTFIFAFFLLTNDVRLAAQTNMSAIEFRNKLDTINIRMAVLMERKDAAELTHYYNDDAVCMPEFYAQLFRKQDIQQFYQHYFSVNTITSYQKSIYEVLCEHNYVIETGTFTSNILKDDKTSFVYKGKYLSIWQVNDKNELKIVSQIWGASNWMDRKMLTELPSQRNASSMPALMKNDLTEEVIARNQMLRQAVVASDAKAQTNFYSDDAIYMPYYDSMYVGKKNIDHYFTTHYSPDWFFDSLSINTSKVIKLENLIIECGYYFVQWGNKKNERGTVTGKSINIWRRDENGVLLMYRQIVKHY